MYSLHKTNYYTNTTQLILLGYNKSYKQYTSQSRLTTEPEHLTRIMNNKSNPRQYGRAADPTIHFAFLPQLNDAKKKSPR